MYLNMSDIESPYLEFLLNGMVVSLAVGNKQKNIITATTEYSSNIVCSVEKENIYGTQFHPEKSDKLGLKMIDNFLKL